MIARGRWQVCKRAGAEFPADGVTVRNIPAAAALGGMMFALRPPWIVPMFMVVGPRTGSSGQECARSAARTSRSFKTAESPSSGYAACAARPAAFSVIRRTPFPATACLNSVGSALMMKPVSYTHLTLPTSDLV